MNTTSDPNGTVHILSSPLLGVYSNVWEPDLQQVSRRGNQLLAWIASSFIIVMSVTGIAKILRRTGWKVFNIAHRSVSFPQRPELFVLIFSSIPTIICILARPLIPGDSPVIGNFIVGWYVCQIRMFLDFFTRTAALFHLLFWAYRDAIITWLYAIHRRVHKIETSVVVKEPFVEPSDSVVDPPPPIVDEARNIFSHRCKMTIPGCIYLVAFFINLPLCFTMKKVELPNGVFVCKAESMYVFYDYFDFIVLVGLPWLAMIIRFYSAALAKEKKSQMIYRLRCYYVTFILLTTPLFVLLITLKIHQFTNTDWSHYKFGSGVIVAMTAYHANFAIKPLIYTTGCNCICCSKQCMERHPRVKFYVVYWSTPQKKEKNVEVKVVPPPKDDGTIADLVDWFGHGDEVKDINEPTALVGDVDETIVGLLDKPPSGKEERVTFQDEKSPFGNGFKVGGTHRSGKGAMLPP